MKFVKRIMLIAMLVCLSGPIYAQDASPPDAAKAKPPAAATTPTGGPETGSAASQPVKAASPSAPAKAPEKASQSVSGDTQKWWQGALVVVLEGVAAIVFPILSVLGMALIRKWNLKIEQDKLDWVLTKSLGFAEQKAKVALKDGKPMDGPSLAKAAVEHGGKLLDQYKLPKKLGDLLADLIEAKLGEKVVEGGGAKKVVNGDAPKPTETEG